MYAIMRNEKRHIGDVGGIQAECNRSPDKPIKLPASDIDWTKTGTNEFYEKCENFRKTIKAECAGKGVDRIRRNAVVMIDSFFGASPDFFTKADPETVDRYFKDCLEFAGKYFGKVINAVRHNDEKTPHLHIQSIPFVANEDGSVSLSAKKLMGTQTDYHRRQDLFYSEVAEKYGFDPCEKVQDAVEKRKHYDSLEYKTLMREQELEQLTKEIEDKNDLIEHKQEEINVKTAELETVNKEVALKTNVLEWALDRIESIYNSIIQYADKIFSGFTEKINAFLEKIQDKKVLTDHDFEAADIKKETLSVSNSYNNPLIVPSTSAGDRLSWSGVSPVYEEIESDFIVPYGAVVNNSGKVISEHRFDWSESFQADQADDIVIPAEKDVSDSLVDLSSLKIDIASVLGKQTDVEKAEEDFSFPDSPIQSDPDDDENGIDDFGID